MEKKQKKIAFIYNSASYLYNFRLGIMLSMKERGWEVMAVSPYNDHSGKIRDNGIRFWNLPLNRKSKNPLSDILIFFRLVRFYKQEKPMIVHHFTIKPVIYGTLAARITRVPVIVNLIPGLGYVFSRGGFLQYVVEKMYRFSLSPHVRVVFQNLDDMTFFIKRKLIRRRQAHLICGSGIDTKLYSPEKIPQKENPSCVRFTLISRMLWDKGVAEFVKAAKLVKKKNPKTSFLLIGGPDKGNPSSIPISWLEKVGNLKFIKWIKHTDDVKPFLARTSVVVLPSYGEGAPRSLIEATAMGKPIIATDVPGCREIVKNGINGFLVPKKNAESLAQAMLILADDAAKRRQMGQASRERALKYFDERHIIKQTLEVYSLLNCSKL